MSVNTTAGAAAGSSHFALEVSGVSKFYGDSTAVDDVSFQLEPGTFLTMLGPSGSGKTTTLNMIAGFSQPDRGSITVNGRDITEIAPHKRGIGVVFQNYALFPHLNVEQNVAFPLEMTGMRRSEALTQARKTLEMVELSACSKHLPRQLSGGQQQRVALARAVVFEPPLLLMDEPLGALDKRLRVQMQIEIMRISRNLGSTVVYVTHDQEEALVMSDLIAVYRNGGIEQLGSSRDLYENPRTLFVADFIGESVKLPCSVSSAGDLIGEGWGGNMPERARTENGRGVLVLRPEDLSLTPDHAGLSAEPNQICGTVADVIYVGSALITLVQIGGAREIEVRAPRSAASLAIRRGDAVRVSWRPDDAVLVPDAGSASRGAETEATTQQLLRP